MTPFASLPPSGNIFYVDDYGIQYTIYWETNEFDGSDFIDITTIVDQPWLPGLPADGYIEDRQVYRKGSRTTIRQVLIPTASGYTILAEGTSHTILYIRTTFHCAARPVDPFRYHLNYAVSADLDISFESGPVFSDPDAPADIIFPVVAADGSLSVGTGYEAFEFIDVW